MLFLILSLDWTAVTMVTVLQCIFVKVQSSRLLADVKSLWQLAGTDAVSRSVKTLLEHSY